MADRYKIYPDKNFAISIPEPGEKTFEELYNLAKTFREDRNFSSVHMQLSDLRGCTFNFNQTEFNPLIELIKSYQDKDNQKMGVYLVDKPFETALVHLFFNEINSKRDYCSTIDKAYSLLSPGFSFKDFKKMIDI